MQRGKNVYQTNKDFYLFDRIIFFFFPRLAIISVLILERRCEVKRAAVIILTFLLLMSLAHAEDREYVFDEERPARNVLAKIEGSDTEMNGEFLMVGAHMDHLGIVM